MAFCTISNPPRPLTSSACPESGSRPSSSAQPITLSTALCLPISSRRTSSSPSSRKSAAACSPPVRPKIACVPRSFSGNRQSISGSNRDCLSGARSPRRRSCAMDSLPQTPHADPAENVRAVLRAEPLAPPRSVTRTMFVFASSRCALSPGASIALISSGFEMIPSVKRKPAANSQSFPGVRIVTPRRCRPERISSGSSPAR